MKKKMFLLLATIILLSSFVVGYAEDLPTDENGGGNSWQGAIMSPELAPTPEEQIASLREKGYSDQDISVASEKLLGGVSEYSGMAPYASWYTFGLTHEQQSTFYNCTPASIRMILLWLNSSFSHSQGTVATHIGTIYNHGTVIDEDVVDYLNVQQSQTTYVYCTNPSLATMKSHLYASVMTYQAPALLCVNINSQTGWPNYDSLITDGHSLALEGTYYDKSKFRVADPIAGCYFTMYNEERDYSSVPQKYDVNASVLHTALSGTDYGYLY